MFLDNIDNDNKWQEFLEYKVNGNFTGKKEKELLTSFINEKKYKKITSAIKDNKYSFSIPKKSLISKNHNGKKRSVYSFKNDEMIVLKYIAYLLYDYDYLFENNLYSFRKNISVKTAIKNINNIYNINKMYGYKIDIKNYFNSINAEILLNNLKSDIDTNLFDIIKDILNNKKAIYNNKIIIEEKGVMAGIPISSFLANYYIREIDYYFKNKKVLYLRYADDIVIFCNNENEIKKYVNILKTLLKKYQLEINDEKELFLKPNDVWEFLGFSFHNKKIDLSKNTIYKMKKKIRRSSRSIRRWMLKKGVLEDIGLKVMIRKYNKKFFGNKNDELSWKYWFFSSINTSKSLKIIDNYLQDNLRYIVTGKHNKKNYKLVPYERLKMNGYKSLVNEYYSFINLKSDM